MPRGQVGQTSTVQLIAQASGNTTSGTHPVSVTNPGGSNTILIIGIGTEDSNDANLPVTAVTVNGSATGVVKALHSRNGTNDSNGEIYYKLNPDVGANSVSVTAVGGVFRGVVLGVFSGVAQAVPEATASSQGTASSISTSVTSLTNFALVVQAASHKPAFSSVTSPSIVVGTTAGQSFEHATLTYKIQAVAGSGTMGQNWGSSSDYAQAMAVFAPVTNVVSRSTPFSDTFTRGSVGSDYSATGAWVVTSNKLVSPAPNAWLNNVITVINTYTDFEATADLTATSGNSQFAFRTTATAGYAVQIRTGDAVLRLERWGSANLAQVAKTFTAGVEYTVRVRCVGTSIKARVWQTGTQEPSTWDIDTTDSTYSRGALGFASEVSGAQFDNLSLLRIPSSLKTSVTI